ncbi:hypothetical protein BDV23DRAFT_183498 [Aspergillus alliaceus]|uniref:Uncharacterized protein n=1 Tax=Petromyces alliaceus TaxID=209559 RepID=A0A5N7C991_PETAA|nr:hypothetical protein BDV23DRAFT_183498 [Aspergillus alliaceus]
MEFQTILAVTLALFQGGLSLASPVEKQVTAAGSNTMDLAIAMLETNDMSANYPYELVHAPPLCVEVPRPVCVPSQQRCYFEVCYNLLYFTFLQHYIELILYFYNKDLRKDINAHPDGYTDAVKWIKRQIENNKKYLLEDTRFWADVTAI